MSRLPAADHPRARQHGGAVRGLSPHDHACASGLHCAAFATGWSAQAIGGLAAMPGVFGLVADRPDRADFSGFMLGRIAADEGEILTIVVAPQARRLGIGQMLLAAALDRFADLSAKAVFLEVAATNDAARRLYDKNGFVEIGRRTNYVSIGSGQRQTAWTMRLDLAVNRKR